MKRHKWSELSARSRNDPVRAARIEEEKRALRDVLVLSALREERQQTQRDVAVKIGVSQARVSKIERQDDLYLSTLAAYIEALGGHLEIAAVFPDERIELVQAESEAAAAS